MGNDESKPIPDQRFTLYIPPFKAKFQANLGRGIKHRINSQLGTLSTNRGHDAPQTDEKLIPTPGDWLLFDPLNNTLIYDGQVDMSVHVDHTYLVLPARAASGDQLWEMVDKYLPGNLRSASLKNRFESNMYPSPTEMSESSEDRDDDAGPHVATPDCSVTSDLLINGRDVKSPPPHYDTHKPQKMG